MSKKEAFALLDKPLTLSLSSDFCTHIPHTGGFNSRRLFLTVPEAASPRPRCWHPVRTLLLACPRPLPAVPSRGRERPRECAHRALVFSTSQHTLTLSWGPHPHDRRSDRPEVQRPGCGGARVTPGAVRLHSLHSPRSDGRGSTRLTWGLSCRHHRLGPGPSSHPLCQGRARGSPGKGRCSHLTRPAQCAPLTPGILASPRPPSIAGPHVPVSLNWGTLARAVLGQHGCHLLGGTDWLKLDCAVGTM